MKKKTLTKTICFKTTAENYNYLKMFGNMNKKLNDFVSRGRIEFELCHGNFLETIPPFGED